MSLSVRMYRVIVKSPANGSRRMCSSYLANRGSMSQSAGKEWLPVSSDPSLTKRIIRGPILQVTEFGRPETDHLSL